MANPKHCTTPPFFQMVQLQLTNYQSSLLVRLVGFALTCGSLFYLSSFSRSRPPSSSKKKGPRGGEEADKSPDSSSVYPFGKSFNSSKEQEPNVINSSDSPASVFQRQEHSRNLDSLRTSSPTTRRMPPTFPWEDSNRQTETSTFPVTPLSLPSSSFFHAQNVEKSKEQAEEFLASMTFAKTGLRTPSCPCCR